MRFTDQHTTLAMILGTLLAVHLSTLAALTMAPEMKGELNQAQLVIFGGLFGLAARPRAQRKEDDNA